ncbi:hypothetical protein SGFS_033940 [Streptomyces graminofaciens]|uniref:Uncharacterized protein n=1 Tax=Streptomyces graminofaciens TaxID=68212 RepID=A0ABN5VG88_9ACTN|nr:hypothetical protein SGFS_033940 [Streptomyces graminofaciens]
MRGPAARGRVEAVVATAGDALASGHLFGRPTGEPPHRCGLCDAIAGAYARTVPSARADHAVSRTELLIHAA